MKLLALIIFFLSIINSDCFAQIVQDDGGLSKVVFTPSKISNNNTSFLAISQRSRINSPYDSSFDLLDKRQAYCVQSGYSQCTNSAYCCPTGSNCCTNDQWCCYGNAKCCGNRTCCGTGLNCSYNSQFGNGCCPTNRQCNNIDGCDVGKRRCAKDQNYCCPTGNTCRYDSNNNAIACVAPFQTFFKTFAYTTTITEYYTSEGRAEQTLTTFTTTLTTSTIGTQTITPSGFGINDIPPTTSIYIPALNLPFPTTPGNPDPSPNSNQDQPLPVLGGGSAASSAKSSTSFDSYTFYQTLSILFFIASLFVPL